MLSSIRNNRKALSIVLWFVIAAFVSTIFVVWGVGEKASGMAYVAKVGDEIISYEEYNGLYREASKLPDFMEINNLEKNVLDTIIANKLLEAEAERLKIPATDVEVMAYISNIPAFQTGGAFDFNQYERVLRANGLNMNKFEDGLRREIRRIKLTNMINQSQSTVSQKELENEYKYRKTKIALDYAAIPLASFAGEYKPAEKEIEEFYNRQKEAYRVPAEIKVKYAVFDKNKFGETFSVSEEEIKKYYDNNKDKYREEENVDISMIVVPVADFGDNKSAEDAENKINAALDALKSGESFENTAVKYSDPALTHDKGYFGKIKRGEVQPELETAAFSLAAGKYSDVIKTSLGYAIVYVNEHNPEKTYSFEEKKSEIADEVKAGALTGSFNSHILNEYRKIADSGNITAYMALSPDNSLEVREIDWTAENGIFPITAIAINQEAKKALYDLSKGEISRIISDGSVSYVFEIEDKKNSFIPAFNDIRNSVEEDFYADKLRKDAVKTVESDLAGSSFENTASKYHAEITRKDFIREAADVESSLAGNRPLIKDISSAKKGDTLKTPYIIGNAVYIFKIADLTPPDMNDLESERSSLTAYISFVKGQVAESGYVNSLKRKTPIVYNEDFLKSMNIAF